MWANFSGKDFDRAGFAAHVQALRWDTWKPQGICLHNTSAPTLAQWAESGPNHAARIANLQSYYEGMGWHAGPAAFISRDHITEFSGFTKPGVHSRCFNATHIGIECVGDYSTEEWDSGDGALVRDNAVFALATLYRALALDPHLLVFHKECAVDNHDCPGRKVNKADVINRVKAAMGYPAPPAAPAEPWQSVGWQMYEDPRMAWIQDTLNLVCRSLPPIPIDGLNGTLTKNLVSAFQRKNGLTVDGIAGDRETIPALKAARAALSGA